MIIKKWNGNTNRGNFIMIYHQTGNRNIPNSHIIIHVFWSHALALSSFIQFSSSPLLLLTNHFHAYAYLFACHVSPLVSVESKWWRNFHFWVNDSFNILITLDHALRGDVKMGRVCARQFPFHFGVAHIMPISRNSLAKYQAGLFEIWHLLENKFKDGN